MLFHRHPDLGPLIYIYCFLNFVYLFFFYSMVHRLKRCEENDKVQKDAARTWNKWIWRCVCRCIDLNESSYGADSTQTFAVVVKEFVNRCEVFSDYCTGCAIRTGEKWHVLGDCFRALHLNYFFTFWLVCFRLLTQETWNHREIFCVKVL